MARGEHVFRIPDPSSVGLWTPAASSRVHMRQSCVFFVVGMESSGEEDSKSGNIIIVAACHFFISFVLFPLSFLFSSFRMGVKQANLDER